MSAPVIKLPERATIAASASFYNEITHELDVHGSLELDATAVSNIDAAFLQLIASAFITADQKGLKLAWKAKSECLEQSARLVGLTALFKL